MFAFKMTTTMPPKNKRKRADDDEEAPLRRSKRIQEASAKNNAALATTAADAAAVAPGAGVPAPARAPGAPGLIRPSLRPVMRFSRKTAPLVNAALHPPFAPDSRARESPEDGPLQRVGSVVPPPIQPASTSLETEHGAPLEAAVTAPRRPFSHMTAPSIKWTAEAYKAMKQAQLEEELIGAPGGSEFVQQESVALASGAESEEEDDDEDGGEDGGEGEEETQGSEVAVTGKTEAGAILVATKTGLRVY